MTEYIPDNFPCMSCGKESVALYMAVPVCTTCNEIVQHKLEKMKFELDNAMRLYRETLRVQLVKGTLHKKKP